METPSPPTQLFHGIRFLLLGFDPINKPQVLRKLVSGGGVDAGQYGPTCTHVIVDKLVYDDPVCVAARRDGKILVSSIWVDHSFDVGVPVDTTSVMYRPMRDLNGIPGAKSLVICLTGYQREDREDIMTMVGLMGAQFSKPLIANKVTHLICYKFEGEKYLLAKKMKRIKLINHRWLEDCLKAWELISEEDYTKSGYEMEMEAEAKDSEDEAGVGSRQKEGKMGSPYQPVIIKQEVITDVPNTNANAEDMVSVTMKTASDQFLNPHENVSGSAARNNIFSASTVANKSPASEAGTALKTMSPTSISKRVGTVNFSDAFNVSSSLVEKFNGGNGSKTASKAPAEEKQSSLLSSKRKMEISSGSSKLQRTSEKLNNQESPRALQELKKDPVAEMSNKISYLNDTSPSKNSPSNVTARKSSSCKGKSVVGGVEDEEFKANKESSLVTKFDSSDVGIVQCEPVEKLSSFAVSCELGKLTNPNMEEMQEASGGSNSKSVKRKSLGKKFSAPKQNISKKKSLNQKGSIFSENSEPRDDENLVNDHKIEEVVKSGTEMEVNDELQTENKSFSCIDDETEPPEEDNKAKEKQGVDIVMEEKAAAAAEEVVDDVAQKNDKNEAITEHGKIVSIEDKVVVEKADDTKNHACDKTSKGKKLPSTKKTIAKRGKKSTKNNNSVEVKTAEGVGNYTDLKKDDENANSASKIVNQKASKRKKNAAAVSVKDKEVTDTKAVNKKKKKKGKSTCSRGFKACEDTEAQKENVQIPFDDQTNPTGKKVIKSDEGDLNRMSGKYEAIWFILTGHRLQRREFQQIIRRLKGRICRVAHQWSYQATHFIVPDPIRRTEKFFAAAASGRWILKTDYLSASNEAGRFVEEEPYEWHKNGLNEDGQINLEAPRKWRLLKEKTGHGAFYGMRILIYGECIAPPLDTLKRAVKAGDGTILATSPPYTRFLNSGGIHFAVVSPGMLHVDVWVQEFIKHEIPCVSADYLVDYVCKPGYPLDKHVQYDTNVWAQRSYKNLNSLLSEPSTPESNDVACEVCGLRDRGEEMLICGDENGTTGCGVGTHIDCCEPPLDDVPQEDWFCPKCTTTTTTETRKRRGSASKKK